MSAAAKKAVDRFIVPRNPDHTVMERVKEFFNRSSFSSPIVFAFQVAPHESEARQGRDSV
jgi:hypothetical protein